MLKKRYGAVAVHDIVGDKVVPKIVSGLAVDVINCTTDDMEELRKLLGDAAVLGRDGTLTLRNPGAVTRQALPFVVSENTGIEVICTRCGSMVTVIGKAKSSESIEALYDKMDETIVIKCTGCGQEVYL